MMKYNIYTTIVIVLLIVTLTSCNLHQNKDGSMERNYQKDVDTIYFYYWPVRLTSEYMRIPRFVMVILGMLNLFFLTVKSRKAQAAIIIRKHGKRCAGNSKN